MHKKEKYILEQLTKHMSQVLKIWVGTLQVGRHCCNRLHTHNSLGGIVPSEEQPYMVLQVHARKPRTTSCYRRGNAMEAGINVGRIEGVSRSCTRSADIARFVYAFLLSYFGSLHCQFVC